MKTLIEILKLATGYLEKQKVPHARRQAEELLADALQMPRLQLYLEHERPLLDTELAIYRETILRRGTREPIQQIRGEVEFFGTSLLIDRTVLIPRHETEQLVEKIVTQLKTLPLKGKILWDLCCGSGCIGIAIKKHLPDLEVILSDLSPQALEIAQKNAKRNNLRVNFYKGDFFEPFKGHKADFITCNPPYVTEDEYETLEPEVRDFEPKLALVAKNSGLDFYQRLATELPHYLNPNGKVFLEFGSTQGEKLSELFQSMAKWRIEKDWAGQNRFFFLEIE